MRLRIPIELLAVSVHKAVSAPQFSTLFLIKITERLHGKRRRVRHRRQGRGRLYDPLVLLGRMSRIPLDAVPSRQTPCVLAIAFVLMRIINTVGPIDERM